MSNCRLLRAVVAVSKVSFNLGFILLGAGLTAGLAYYVGSELFSADSPPNIMENAVKHIQAHSGVCYRRPEICCVAYIHTYIDAPSYS